MGTLVVMAYPTKLFADLADHTYVKCGNDGMAWSCWGGKQGGKELKRAEGSTARADAIAGANERAGIKCYLVNGVCHQAANRILLPAGITVQGARGYHVSESLFGTYGRPTGPLGTCASPFDQEEGVSGDLPACEEAAPALVDAAEAGASANTRRASKNAEAARTAAKREAKYLKGVLRIYGKAKWSPEAPRAAQAEGLADAAAAKAPRLTAAEVEGFELALFMHKVDHHLGEKLGKAGRTQVEHIRRSTGRSMMTLHQWFSDREMKPAEYVKAFNQETLLFQQSMANALKGPHYKALFGLAAGDFVVLADPRITKTAFKDL